MSCTKKRGFTLVEILIAATILSLILVISYKVFVSFSRSFQQGSWSLNTQNKLRNALSLIREEMQKATPLTVVSMSGTAITEASYELNLTYSAIGLDADGWCKLPGNSDIASWYICLPYVTGDADSPGARFKCELKLENGQIIYTKTLEDGSDPKNKERIFNNHRIIEDVASVLVKLDAFDPDDKTAMVASLVSLKVRVDHPDKNAYEFAHVIAETGAKIEVPVNSL
ncbi:MAG: prepilin-type N-terminal cleavage/methylation domain-containing protein [Candidatus Riflebacteria bacterium]|nr:prepilin-type N-terminal cleavage/methylation domain-containing protein [Candidatus Riflebacteria bacterium]